MSGVDLVGVELERVSRWSCDQSLTRRPQRASQPGHEHLNGVKSAPGGIFWPKLIDQAICGDRLVCPEGKDGQERALAMTAQLGDLALDPHLKRAQDAELNRYPHGQTVTGKPSAPKAIP